MWTGTLEFDLLLGDVHSLKAKRGLVRPLVGEIRRRFHVAVAEVGTQDLHRRATVGVAAVGSSAHHVHDIVDEVERFVVARPEMELLATHRCLYNSDDE